MVKIAAGYVSLQDWQPIRRNDAMTGLSYPLLLNFNNLFLKNQAFY